MRWISELDEMRTQVRAWQAKGERVGVVPTMGNLHDGHMALVRQAKSECERVVVTLFVNPLQFGVNEDFSKYPRTPQRDRELCEQAGVDAIFAPSAESMYPKNSKTIVQVREIEEPLCGQSRPGHFVGVATVVAKLFHIVPADFAYFGLKDYQQTRIIKRMVEDLNFPITLRLCPTIREPDGLAMSSRNAYLDPQERQQATVLNRALDLAEKLVKEGTRDTAVIRQAMLELIDSQPLAKVDYVEFVDAETLSPASKVEGPLLAAVAVRFRSARLIDNRVLSP